jgi:MFS family permease
VLTCLKNKLAERVVGTQLLEPDLDNTNVGSVDFNMTSSIPNAQFQGSHQGRTFWSSILGNTLDHYDTALYGFLAPFISPLFFPHYDPVGGLILTYWLMSLSLFTRPLGAYFFGKYSGTVGPRQALILSLSGIALATCFMGMVPTYDQVGPWAPAGLAILRACQGFFASGESTIAALFILESQPLKKRGWASSVYQSSSVLGIMMASALVTGLSSLPDPSLYWRWPFLAGLLTAGVGIFMRVSLKTLPQSSPSSPSLKITLAYLLRNHKANLVRLTAVSSFTYLTYAVPFVFMNSFIPHITSISLTEMMMVNTGVLAADMVLLPFFGWISDHFSHGKFMACMSGLLGLTAVPLFLILPQASLLTVTCVRFWIVVLGLAFLAPLHAWTFDQIKGKEKYIICGVGYALGSEVFGRSIPSICLGLWYGTQWAGAPALYISFISMAATISLMSCMVFRR